jgi:flagellar motor switch protein FliN/FliY
MNSPAPAVVGAAGGTAVEALVPAAAALADRLPSAEPLTPGVPGSPADVDPAEWAAAAVAPLATAPGARVGVLVRRELVDALAAAPSGALDVAAALQPALDAAAAALGGTAGIPSTLTDAAMVTALEEASAVVPLVAGTEVAAVMFVTPAAVAGAPGAAPTAPPVGAPAGHPSNLGSQGVELLHGVAMEVTVELGRTRLSVRELLALAPGEVLELDRPAGGPADLLVNGRLIARGEVVVVDEDFALRVTEIVAQPRAS